MLKRIRNFFGEVKVEAQKANYPSKDELIGSVWVVITTVVIVSLFLGVVDMGLSRLIKLLLR